MPIAFLPASKVSSNILDIPELIGTISPSTILKPNCLSVVLNICNALAIDP